MQSSRTRPTSPTTYDSFFKKSWGWFGFGLALALALALVWDMDMNLDLDIGFYPFFFSSLTCPGH
jgi:hypothetical protein